MLMLVEDAAAERWWWWWYYLKAMAIFSFEESGLRGHCAPRREDYVELY